MHLALKSSWLFQSALGEGTDEHSVQLSQEIEMAIVNSKPVPPGSASYSPSFEVLVPDLFERRKAVNKLQTSHILSRRAAAIQRLVGVRNSDSSMSPESKAKCRAVEKKKQPSGPLVDSQSIDGESTNKTALADVGVTPSDSKEVDVPIGEPESSSQQPAPIDGRSEMQPVVNGATESVVDKSALQEQQVKEEGLANNPGPPQQQPVKVEEGSAKLNLPQQQQAPRPSPGRSAVQKQRVAKGFVSRVAPVSLPGARVKLPSVYSKLGSPLQYSSFRGN